MSRKKRVWYNGAQYHVMGRGNRRSDIFREPEDFMIYRMFLEKSRQRFPFVLISYCLMTNHIHLQIKTLEHELGKIMQMINFNYTVYFNKKYNLDGHLFQGRYHACLIEDDAYVLATSRYIHLNPVKAKMVTSVEHYPYSSYLHFIGKKQDSLVDARFVWRYFEKDPLKAYQAYVEDHMTHQSEDRAIRLLIMEDESCQPL